MEFGLQSLIAKSATATAPTANQMATSLNERRCELDKAVAGRGGDGGAQEGAKGAVNGVFVDGGAQFPDNIERPAGAEPTEGEIDFVAGPGAAEAIEAELGVQAFDGPHNVGYRSIFLPLRGKNCLWC